MKKQGLSDGGDGVPLFLANFPEGLLCPMPRLPLMVRAAQLRRSCDGVAAATESLPRRICADQLRRAHSARRDATRSSAARTMSGRRGIGQPLENHCAAPRRMCHRDIILQQTVFL